jgi:phage shock protein PspC (stress-responsive transcriptional regulator)
MTKSNDAPPQQGHGLDGFYEALRRPGIVRSSDGKWFAGVSTGLARWLGVDPLIVRAGFILFSIFFGMGVALYLTLWLLMPDERGEIHIERALKHGEGSSIFLLIVTAISVLGGGPWWGGDLQGLRFGGFVVLGVLAWWFLTRTDSGRQLIGWPWKEGERAGSGTTGASADPASGHTGSGHTASGASVGTASTGNAAANAGAAMAGQRTTPPWQAPAQTQAPARTPVPRERVRSIGFAAGLLGLGLAVLVGALFTQLARTGDWPGNPVAVGIAAGVGVLGLGILIAGIAGRRSGWLAPFAWLGMIAAVFATAMPAGLTTAWGAGDRSYAPTSVTPPPEYQLAAGQMQLDLTHLTSAELNRTAGADTVKATVGLGELDIVVPDGVRVTVHAKGRAGEVSATGSNQASTPSRMEMMGDDEVRQDGTNWNETITYGPTTGTDLVVNAEVGLGAIKISEASAS